ncbi:hypothetical protein A0J61_09643 [Choanephora cucurbitarum]|uniref:Uncharacterized protein n=1 Tax=Choanephora cucurbitarum TaxID=101091 RepID=A0A1C7MZN6_9FUNG|nr:hypothetical protein A0J61_09643 [Choanephora cucurbitarum]
MEEYLTAVEPADETRRKDSSGANLPTSNSGHPVLAEYTVVPAGHRDAVTSHTLPFNSNQTNTLRLDALRSSSLSKGLSQESMAMITHPRLVDSSTNRPYRCVSDLTNFLSHLHHVRGYLVGTLKLVRAAVTHLHHLHVTINQQSDNPVVSLLDSLASQIPPRSQYKPAVDLSKTLKFLVEIPSSTTTALPSLQGKVAFLMGMAAFLRPSDLQPPKECRKKERIIKQLTIHPHANNASLCSLAAFLALRLPSQPVLSTTIASWICRLIRRSTSERNVSLRSTSSTTFENHYKRQSAMRTDFTTAVLSDIPISMDSDTEDDFKDALSDFRS